MAYISLPLYRFTCQIKIVKIRIKYVIRSEILVTVNRCMLILVNDSEPQRDQQRTVLYKTFNSSCTSADSFLII